jgi:hypothetical protein
MSGFRQDPDVRYWRKADFGRSLAQFAAAIGRGCRLVQVLVVKCADEFGAKSVTLEFRFASVIDLISL